MSNLEVRIVNLPPMRVACVNGFGEGPEGMAFEKMKAWAEKLTTCPADRIAYSVITILILRRVHRITVTMCGSPWMNRCRWMGMRVSLNSRVGCTPWYAHRSKDPEDDIPGTWQRLVKWMESSKYRHGRHQWLEEHIGPLDEMGGEQPFTLDLHLPISE